MKESIKTILILVLVFYSTFATMVNQSNAPRYELIQTENLLLKIENRLLKSQIIIRDIEDKWRKKQLKRKKPLKQ